MSSRGGVTTCGTLSPILVYDNECGFCSQAVQFVLRHERRHDLLFVGRESESGKELRRFYGLESMLWIEGGQAFARSGAALKVAEYLGGVWSLMASLGSICPKSIRDPIYNGIARNRRRLLTACPVPAPEQRARFLE